MSLQKQQLDAAVVCLSNARHLMAKTKGVRRKRSGEEAEPVLSPEEQELLRQQEFAAYFNEVQRSTDRVKDKLFEFDELSLNQSESESAILQLQQQKQQQQLSSTDKRYLDDSVLYSKQMNSMDYFQHKFLNAKVANELESTKTWLEKTHKRYDKLFGNLLEMPDEQEPHPPLPSSTAKAKAKKSRKKSALPTAGKRDGEEDEEEVDSEEERLANYIYSPEAAELGTFGAQHATENQKNFSELLERCNKAKAEFIVFSDNQLEEEEKAIKQQIVDAALKLKAATKQVSNLKRQIEIVDSTLLKYDLSEINIRKMIEDRLKPTLSSLEYHERKQLAQIEKLNEAIRVAQECTTSMEAYFLEIANKKQDVDPHVLARASEAVASVIAQLENDERRVKRELAIATEDNKTKALAIRQAQLRDKSRLDRLLDMERELIIKVNGHDARVETETNEFKLKAKELRQALLQTSEKSKVYFDVWDELLRAERRAKYMEERKNALKRRSEQERATATMTRRVLPIGDAVGGVTSTTIVDPYAVNNRGEALEGAVEDLDELSDDFDSGDERPSARSIAKRKLMEQRMVNQRGILRQTLHGMGLEESDNTSDPLGFDANNSVRSSLVRLTPYLANVPVPAFSGPNFEKISPRKAKLSTRLASKGVFTVESIVTTKRELFLIDKLAHGLTTKTKKTPSAIIGGVYSLFTSAETKFVSQEAQDPDPVMQLLDQKGFNLANGLDVLTRVIEGLVEHGLLDEKQAARWGRDAKFLRRSQRTLGPIPTQDGVMLENAARNLCSEVFSSLLATAPRALVLRNKRFLLCSTLLRALAIVGIPLNCCGGSSWSTLNEEDEVAKNDAVEEATKKKEETAAVVVDTLELAKREQIMEDVSAIIVSLVAAGSESSAGVLSSTTPLSNSKLLASIRSAVLKVGGAEGALTSSPLFALDCAIQGYSPDARIDARGRNQRKDEAGEEDDEDVIVLMNHRHVVAGYAIYLMCATADKIQSTNECLGLFTRAVQYGEMIGRPKNVHEVFEEIIPTHSLKILLQKIKPSVIPGILALDLFMRVMEEELSRKLFLQRIALREPEVMSLQFLNVTLPVTIDVAISESVQLRKKEAESNASNATKAKRVVFMDESAAPKVQKGLQYEQPVPRLELLALPQPSNNSLILRENRRDWLDGLSVYIDTMCERIHDLVLSAHVNADGQIEEDEFRLPLPSGLKKEVIQLVRKLRTIAAARPEDGERRVALLQPTLREVVKRIYAVIDRLLSASEAFANPLADRRDWLQRQYLVLKQDLDGHRLKLQEGKSKHIGGIKQLEVIRSGKVNYGKGKGKTLVISAELRKVLEDPDTDNLGPTLSMLRDNIKELTSELKAATEEYNRLCSEKKLMGSSEFIKNKAKMAKKFVPVINVKKSKTRFDKFQSVTVLVKNLFYYERTGDAKDDGKIATLTKKDLDLNYSLPEIKASEENKDPTLSSVKKSSKKKEGDATVLSSLGNSSFFSSSVIDSSHTSLADELREKGLGGLFLSGKQPSIDAVAAAAFSREDKMQHMKNMKKRSKVKVPFQPQYHFDDSSDSSNPLLMQGPSFVPPRPTSGYMKRISSELVNSFSSTLEPLSLQVTVSLRSPMREEEEEDDLPDASSLAISAESHLSTTNKEDAPELAKGATTDKLNVTLNSLLHPTIADLLARSPLRLAKQHVQAPKRIKRDAKSELVQGESATPWLFDLSYLLPEEPIHFGTQIDGDVAEEAESKTQNRVETKLKFEQMFGIKPGESIFDDELEEEDSEVGGGQRFTSPDRSSVASMSAMLQSELMQEINNRPALTLDIPFLSRLPPSSTGATPLSLIKDAIYTNTLPSSDEEILLSGAELQLQALKEQEQLEQSETTLLSSPLSPQPRAPPSPAAVRAKGNSPLKKRVSL